MSNENKSNKQHYSGAADASSAPRALSVVYLPHKPPNPNLSGSGPIGLDNIFNHVLLEILGGNERGSVAEFNNYLLWFFIQKVLLKDDSGKYHIPEPYRNISAITREAIKLCIDLESIDEKEGTFRVTWRHGEEQHELMINCDSVYNDQSFCSCEDSSLSYPVSVHMKVSRIPGPYRSDVLQRGNVILPSSSLGRLEQADITTLDIDPKVLKLFTLYFPKGTSPDMKILFPYLVVIPLFNGEQYIALFSGTNSVHLAGDCFIPLFAPEGLVDLASRFTWKELVYTPCIDIIELETPVELEM